MAKIPQLHSWKRGTGLGWAQVQRTEAQEDLAIAQSPPIAMDGGQGHGKELQPSLHKDAPARKQQGSRVLGQKLTFFWGGKRSRPFREALFLGKVMSFWTNPSSGTISLSSEVFLVGCRAKLQS